MPTARARRRRAPRPSTAAALVCALAALAGAWLATAGAVAAATGVPTPMPVRPSPRGLVLWLDPSTPAARALATLPPERAADAALLHRVTDRAQGTWITASTPASAVRARVAAVTQAGRAAGAVPTLTLYALPQLDCQRGGIGTDAGYRQWVDEVAAGIGTARAIVVVEPDALAMLGCLSATDQARRLALLRYAVSRLGTDPFASVYLDAGHEGWQSSTTMAARLDSAGVAAARGFSLNVSNFDATDVEVGYGRRISAKLATPRPFVVDVGRNGLGPATGPLAWCNPPGRALGAPPTTTHPDPLVDALLWIKPPGESDGTCRPGEPPAGQFWLDYALGLAARATR